MKVVKIPHELKGNFLTISKTIFQDKNVSWQAAGFFAAVMSIGPKWKYSIEGLASLKPGGRDRLYSMINELIAAGYVKREAVREGQRIVEWIYVFDEMKVSNSVLTESQEVDKMHANSLLPESQQVDSQEVETQEQENPTQLNTKDLIDTQEELKDAAAAAAETDPVERRIWKDGVELLRQDGINEAAARSFLGVQAKKFSKRAIAEAIAVTQAENPADRKSFLVGVLNARNRQAATARVGAHRNNDIEEDRIEFNCKVCHDSGTIWGGAVGLVDCPECIAAKLEDQRSVTT